MGTYTLFTYIKRFFPHNVDAHRNGQVDWGLYGSGKAQILVLKSAEIIKFNSFKEYVKE